MLNCINEDEDTQWLAAYPDIPLAQRVAQQALQRQFLPTFVVDQHAVNTFDNKTYRATLGQCWHAAMQTVPLESADSSSSSNEDDRIQQISILIRDSDSKGSQKDVRIIAKQSSGDVQLDLTPGRSSISVVLDGQQQHIPQDEVLEIQSSDYQDQPLFRIYQVSKNVMQVDVRGEQIQVQYDGQRMKVMATDNYRNQIRGLSGTLTGEQADDFVVPKNCVIRDERHFAASYALTADHKCQGPAKELQEQAKRVPCFERETLFGNVISEPQGRSYKWRKYEASASSSSSSSSSDCSRSSSSSSSESSSSESQEWKQNKHASSDKQSHSKRPIKFQIQYVEKDNEICFSLHAQPACEQGHKPSKTQEKKIEVYCRPAHDSLAQMYKQQIHKGANPDISAKRSDNPRFIKFKLPVDCQAKY